MHIVYVSREFPPSQRGGGIASYIKELAGAMVKRGHKVTVVCASDDTRLSSDTMVDGIHVIRLVGGDFVVPGIEPTTVLNKLRSLTRFRSYRKKVRDTILNLERVDVIEVPEFGAEAYYLNNLNIPITIRLHTPTLLDRETQGIRKFPLSKFPERIIGKLEMSILRHCYNITSCTHSLKDWFANNTDIPISNIKVLYNPINLKCWMPADENYVENGIFFAGTVAKLKGIGELIRACALLRNEGIPVTLRIAGKLGDYGKALKHQCESNHYDWCEFLGHVNRDVLRMEYARAKVSCFPSWWEAMGLVCLEAMAVGNIVIGSNSGGMAEILEDEYNGLLVAPKDYEVLAQKLKEALGKTNEQIQQIKANAHESLIKKFSTDIIAKQFEEYYESII